MMNAVASRRMRRRIVSISALILIMAGSLVINQWPKAQQPPRHDPVVPDVMGRYTYADLSDKVLPAVVTVYVKRDMAKEMTPDQLEQYKQFREFFGNPRLRQLFPQMPFDEPPDSDEEGPMITTTSGSGVIVSEDGYIITSQHVVGDKADQNEITVTLADDTEVTGKDVQIIWPDKLLDLALIKINRKDLKPIKWGNSDALRIGEMVAAIGSPLDLRRTVTSGIVCAMHREVGGGLGNMIQTDAVINPGSSGGALVNLDGELVGINRLITTNTGRWQGYGFAVPSNEARAFAEEVIAKGKVVHGYIGIAWAGPDQDDPKMREALGIEKDAKGVLIKDVTPGAPADQAGLRSGDFLTQVDNEQIKRWSDLLSYVSRQPVGKTLKVSVLRPDDGGKVRERTFNLTVTERPDEDTLLEMQRGGKRATPTPTPKPGDQKLELGLEVEPYNEGGQQGLRVVRVQPRTPAAKAGLQAGDVLLQLNRMSVKTVDELRAALKANKSGRPHLLNFMREGRTQLTPIEQQGAEQE